MKTLGDVLSYLEREIGDRSLTVSVSRVDADSSDLFISVDGLPSDTFGGRDPRSSSPAVKTSIFSSARRCFRVESGLTIEQLEFELTAEAYRLGSAFLERIHSSGGYSEPGLGHLNEFGVAPYEISVSGSSINSHVGESSLSEAARAAATGHWFWRFAVAPKLRRVGYPHFDKEGKWFKIAKSFDRSWGQMEGLQVVYHFEPRKGPRVEVWSLTLMQPTPWEGRKAQMSHASAPQKY